MKLLSTTSMRLVLSLPARNKLYALMFYVCRYQLYALSAGSSPNTCPLASPSPHYQFDQLLRF